jgi:C1A family cysteine protease
MSIDSFKSMSEDLSEKMYWYPLMNEFQRFETRYSDTDQAYKVLNQVKENLAKGNRVTFGTFLVIGPYCSAGACANYKSKQDTWALTKDIELPPYFTGGHEMVIIGYDDNAVATDNEGKQHQGLLTLRNSWGDDVGDHGNYYMTYDYFMKFAGEVQVIAEMK